MPSILIVDDLISIHEMLEAVIEPTGFSTAFATDGEKGLAQYKAGEFDLVLVDIDMKPMDGITLLKQIKRIDPSAVVVIMTAYASTESAVPALKYGAFDYLQKPFKIDELIQTLKRGLEFKKISSQQKASANSVEKTDSLDVGLIGNSQPIQQLTRRISKLVDSGTPILLQGEIGSGKREIGEMLHATRSKEAPLVKIDCAHSSKEGFREGLLGENGTGGNWIVEAEGGTLFLQNIQSLPLEIQPELVSVLRNSGKGFRLICSSDVDLEALTEEKQFDEELFYRVAMMPLVIPPLRKRLEDIPLLLADAASKVTNPHFETNKVEFTEDALQALKSYYWPGNLAEFYQVISKVISNSDSRVISSKQLPLKLHDLATWPSLEAYLDGQEEEYTQLILSVCNDDIELATQVLKCSPEKFVHLEAVS
ncbi:MAG: sigma-54-dependent Fis family transcriptional regulator [Opitutaceae bacterium]|nr:sigma-54-dependent Fis family transcriptional regulator [Opitutaceae bacterium]